MTWKPAPQSPCPCSTCKGETEPPAPVALTAEQRRILDTAPNTACGVEGCVYCGPEPIAPQPPENYLHYSAETARIANEITPWRRILGTKGTT